MESPRRRPPTTDRSPVDHAALTGPQALAVPRFHTSDREPLEFLEFAFTDRVAQEILDGLAAMGHRVRRQHEEVEGAGAAHCVELLAREQKVRASGDTWAAGIA